MNKDICPYLSKRWGKTLHIFDPILRQNYYFVHAKDKDEYHKIVKKEFKVDLPNKGSGGSFNVISQNDIEIGLLWAKKNDICNLAHECFHAISYTLRQRGIELSAETDEIYAYHLAFLMRTIREKL